MEGFVVHNASRRADADRGEGIKDDVVPVSKIEIEIEITEPAENIGTTVSSLSGWARKTVEPRAVGRQQGHHHLCLF